jgi:hypothetical protein
MHLPCLPFLPPTPCRVNKVFFHSWELKAGKGSARERMERDCSIPFMSFFKWFYILKNPISLVFQHTLNPKFYHPLAALMSNCKSFFSRQIPAEIFSSKSLHTDMGCPNLLNKWVEIFRPQSKQFAFYKLVIWKVLQPEWFNLYVLCH